MEASKRPWIDRLMALDKRVIFLLMALSVVIPLLHPIGFPMEISPEVQSLYDAVEELPRGSVMLISHDYDPATRPELYPMALAMLRHAFKRDLKVVNMALWPLGVSLAEEALSNLKEEFPDKEYGRDYVVLGYKSGGLVVINLLGQASFGEVYPSDIKGQELAEIPMMTAVGSLQNVDFVFDLSAGDPGIPHWVMFAADRYGRKVGGGCTAVSAPQFYPYLQSGQLVGLLGGLKGAAEYEKLVGVPGTATAGMDAQSIAHLLIILFIILGNIGFFLEKRRRAIRQGGRS